MKLFLATLLTIPLITVAQQPEVILKEPATRISSLQQEKPIFEIDFKKVNFNNVDGRETIAYPQTLKEMGYALEVNMHRQAEALGCLPKETRKQTIYLCKTSKDLNRIHGLHALVGDKRAAAFTEPWGNNNIYVDCSKNDGGKLPGTLLHECSHVVYKLLMKKMGSGASSLFINEGYAELQQVDAEYLQDRLFSAYHYFLDTDASDNVGDQPALFDQIKATKYPKENKVHPFFAQGTSFMMFLCFKENSCEKALQKISVTIQNINKKGKKGKISKKEGEKIFKHLEEEWAEWMEKNTATEEQALQTARKFQQRFQH